jgi:purine catabolism regulator
MQGTVRRARRSLDWGVPLGDLLQLPSLAGSRVVAGEAGLRRRVLGINVMEVPGRLDWVRPGDFICSTAYTIRDSQEAQEQLIPALAAKGVVGLGIKTLYVPHIPDAMARVAAALHFPLVEFPADVSFSDVIRLVMTEVLHAQTAFLEESERIHRRLMEVALNEGGLKALLQAMAPVVNNPALVEDHMGTVVATTGESAHLFDALRTSLPAPGDTEAAADVSGFSERSLVMWDGRPVGRVAMAVQAAGRYLGRLVIWEIHERLSRLGYRVMEQGATIAALLLLQGDAAAQVERRYRNLFLDQLLTGRIESVQAAHEHARLLGWDVSGPFVVMVARVFPDNFIERERVISRVVLRPLPGPDFLAVGERGGDLVYLYRPHGTRARDAAQRAAEAAQAILRDIRAVVARVPARVGISRVCLTVQDAPGGYREALEAVTVGRHPVQTFDQMGILRLLHHVANPQEIERFVADTIRPLVHYDEVHHAGLLETLKVFLNVDGSVGAAAKHLHVHYNTVYYRLWRIRQLTGYDPRDAEDRLSLQVGLKLLDLLPLQRAATVTAPPAASARPLPP